MEVGAAATCGLRAEVGVADIGFGWAAWIVDPAANVLGVLAIRGIAGDRPSLLGAQIMAAGVDRTFLMNGHNGPNRTRASRA